MQFFRRMAPMTAYKDLRVFLARREPYQLWFLFASVAITAVLLAMFVHDSAATPAYKPDIIYVQQWPADRTLAQIHAQQKIDAAKKAKDDAELAKLQAQRRAEFQRIDNQLKRMGF